MTISSKGRFNLVLALCLTLIVLPASIDAQNKNGSEPEFKIPDGYMRMQMASFRGVLMLDPEKPAGMFVTYPDDNESYESLRQRILAFVAPMFIHYEEGKATPPITWVPTTLPSHFDTDGQAFMNVYSGSGYEMQVSIYEHAGPHPFLYGYFAMRHHPGKSDDGKFQDGQGQGIKAFEKLWKSFPK